MRMWFRWVYPLRGKQVLVESLNARLQQLDEEKALLQQLVDPEKNKITTKSLKQNLIPITNTEVSNNNSNDKQ